MVFVGILLIVLFVAAQGAVVFGTAYLALRSLKVSNWFGKFVAMSISYAAWVAITILGYGLLGGSGDLMDGFGLVLSLCFTAMISSFAYLLIWTLRASNKGASG